MFRQDYDNNLRSMIDHQYRNAEFGEPVRPPGQIEGEAKVTAVFESPIEFMVQQIKKYDFCFGCVAWLTDHEFLKSLRNKDSAFIVQKEDFLRPDYDEAGFIGRLTKDYSALRSTERQHFHSAVGELSFGGCPEFGVRCVGLSKKGIWARPNMHHKFIVLGDVGLDRKHDGVEIFHKPKAVITGSCNITRNGRNSLENMVMIESEEIAEHYYQQFGVIATISEPLNWDKEYIAPQWKFGT